MRIKVENAKTKKANPNMFGMFFEDINYGLDGGLYHELLENRSFEFMKTSGPWNKYTPVYNGLYGWEAVADDVILSLSTKNPAFQNTPHYLEYSSVTTGGFTNQAYEGIYLNKNQACTVSFYAKTENYAGTVSIQVTLDQQVYARVDFSITKDGQWHRYEAKFSARETIEKGKFCVYLNEAGTVGFDHFSVIPEDSICGIFRPDLAKALKDCKPSFVRFPGGCVVEGNNLANRYQWKETLGTWENRVPNWNRWAVHNSGDYENQTTPFSHYNQTLGVGYYEYFLLCEYLEAQPLPVLNVGLACQYQSDELVSMESEKFQEYIQDALDLIEFANGSVDSKWGSVRVQMGHVEPFHLQMLGIGNEQWETEKVDFFARYEAFYQAIHAKYPDIKLIGSAGPNVGTDTFKAAWEFYRGRAKDTVDFVYAIDEHYYMKPDWFFEQTKFYDEYPRDVNVFAGEYAAHESNVAEGLAKSTWRAALSEAAFMTGLVRNGDIVKLASYAPLLAREGYAQWAPDLIWFDAKTICLTPSYLIQQLYATHMGDEILTVDCEDEGVFTAATAVMKDKRFYLIIVNTQKLSKDIKIELPKGWQSVEEERITADLDTHHTLGQENLVSVKKQAITGTDITIEPYSVVVLTGNMVYQKVSIL